CAARGEAAMSRSRPVPFVVLVVALFAVLTLSGGPALAATVTATSGSPGAYHVRDSTTHNGVTCSYDHDSGALTSIKVHGPTLWPNAHNSSGEWVGWQVIVQKTTASGGGSWVLAHKGAVQTRWATNGSPAV